MVSMRRLKWAFGGWKKTWAYFCWPLKSSQWSPCLRGLPEEGGMGSLGEKTPEAVLVSKLCEQNEQEMREKMGMWESLMISQVKNYQMGSMKEPSTAPLLPGTFVSKFEDN